MPQPRHSDGTFATKTGSAPEVGLDDDIAYYQREVSESFRRGILTLSDMAETSQDSARIASKRDGLAKAWDRQGDRIRNAKTARDLAAIIGFIQLEAEDASDNERQGAELAVSYLQQFSRWLPNGD